MSVVVPAPGHLNGGADRDGLVRVDALAKVQRVARRGEELLQFVLQREDARGASHEHAVAHLRGVEVNTKRRGK